MALSAARGLDVGKKGGGHSIHSAGKPGLSSIERDTLTYDVGS